MSAKVRDLDVTRKILRELDEVDAFLHGVPEEAFLSSPLLQKAVVMSLINIGELSKAYTAAFFAATPHIPWQGIRSARNVAAHTYEAIDMLDVYETYRQDLPALRAALDKELRRLETAARQK